MNSGTGRSLRMEMNTGRVLGRGTAGNGNHHKARAGTGSLEMAVVRNNVHQQTCSTYH